MASPPEVCQTFKEVLSTLRAVGDERWARAVASALGVCLAGIRPEGKVRPPRGEIWSSEKVDLGESESTCKMVLLVDQSSPDFFRRTREESRSITCISDFFYISIHSGDIRDQILKLSEIDRNFARFWPPTFFWRSAPKILGPTL